MIDLRSDTVTHPTAAMRQAMAQAAVGDDVYGEDPTVARLETAAAQRVGKEAALFVPSGTMGNLIAILEHCRRGTAALVGDESHIYNYEGRGASVLGSVALQPLPNTPWGEIPLEAISLAIAAGQDIHGSPPGLICLESSHNRCGGTVPSLDYMATLAAHAAAANLPIHLDGARLFNAAHALGVQARDITAHVTTVQFCLSKGLAAPAGSILAGPRDFIARARRLRKMLGGGMRQVGVLAAPGLVALNEMSERLATDHANARQLALSLAELPEIAIDVSRVQTNIILFKLRATSLSAAAFLAQLKEEGVLMGPMKDSLRAVTHHDVDSAACEQAATTVRRLLLRAKQP